MKAKKPLLLAVLILALLAVALIVPAAVSGVPADNSKVVTFDGYMYTNPGPPGSWPTDAAPPATVVFYGYRFAAPNGSPGDLTVIGDEDPGDIGYEEYEDLWPLCGYGQEFVYINQGNLHTHGISTVAHESAGIYGGSVWEWVSVGQMPGPGEPLHYHAWGQGVSGAVKGWVLHFEVTSSAVPGVAAVTGYYIKN